MFELRGLDQLDGADISLYQRLSNRSFNSSDAYAVFANISNTAEYTTSNTPPPGPNLSIFATYPLYNALNPSSLATTPRLDHAQAYFCLTPGVLATLCIRLLTTSNGVLNVVPTTPPTNPAMRSFPIFCLLGLLDVAGAGS